MYQIYKITSPSGKFYIGLTSQTIKVRWGNHVRKAFKRPDYNHGFYNAIRKYGPAAFTIEELCKATSKQEAQRLEKKYIAAADKGLLYNVSPGGEADGEVGMKLFWEAINADPVAKASYLQRLSDAKKKADWSDYDLMSEQAAQWRKDNPKEAYKLARRGTRIANRSQPRKPADTRTLKERLLWKHKKGEVVRKNTTEFWASCPSDKRAGIVEKIRSKAKEQWAAVTDVKARSELTAKARSAIDRKKQGAAASKGIKQWWVDLKADPVRYAAHIALRTASLKKTLEGKT